MRDELRAGRRRCEREGFLAVLFIPFSTVTLPSVRLYFISFMKTDSSCALSNVFSQGFDKKMEGARWYHDSITNELVA